jgi:hypothetical protein
LENPEKLELVDKFVKDTNILDVYDTIKKSRAAFKKRLQDTKRRSMPAKTASVEPPVASPPPPAPPPPPPPVPLMTSAVQVGHNGKILKISSLHK